MTSKARIFTVVLALALAPFAVRADEADVAAGATLIDIGGDVATAGIAGGMADPVPLFAGDNGPAVFVMGVEVPGATPPSMETQLTETMLEGFKPHR